MTFAVWFTALLAVFTFSSCLDDDNGGQRQGSEIVKVLGGFGAYEFESAAGYRLVPTNMSQITVDVNTNFAFIAYTYDSGLVNENTKKISVQLNGILPINYLDTEATLEGMKEFSNAPIRNINAGGSYEFFPISFWNATKMFLPVTFFVKDFSDPKELQKEINSHYFQIFFDVNSEECNSGDLVFHVGHRVADPSLNKDRSRKYSTNIYEVDLSMAVGMFEQVYTKKPDRIIFKYEESYAGEYKENEMTQSTVEIDYRAILNATKK